jgi:hypothetical protein
MLSWTIGALKRAIPYCEGGAVWGHSNVARWVGTLSTRYAESPGTGTVRSVTSPRVGVIHIKPQSIMTDREHFLRYHTTRREPAPTVLPKKSFMSYVRGVFRWMGCLETDVDVEVHRTLASQDLFERELTTVSVRRHAKKFMSRYAQPKAFSHPYSAKLMNELSMESLDDTYYKKALERLNRWFKGVRSIHEFAISELERRQDEITCTVSEVGSDVSGMEYAISDEDWLCEQLGVPTSDNKYKGINESLGVSSRDDYETVKRNALYREIVGCTWGKPLRHYCENQCIEVPILRPTDSGELLTLCYQIIEASIIHRRELADRENLLRSQYVKMIDTDVLSDAQLRRWEDVTASADNMYSGVDPRVPGIPHSGGP